MQKYFLPPEWHPQSCIQLSWPHADTDWRPYLDEMTSVMVSLVEAITRFEPVVVASQEPQKTVQALAEQLSVTQMERVKVYPCELDDTWARDCGGITLLPTHTEDEPLILDFKFNGWGEKFPATKDNLVTRRLHSLGAFQGQLLTQEHFVLEGGSIESDGQGTIFTTVQCLLAPHRNQPFTQWEIEEKLLTLLHAERIVWLHHGQLIGDDTDGHIDTIVRICPDDTILYVQAPKEDNHYADLHALEEELHSLRTLRGTPYRLLPLPLPKPIYYDGERLPATYANFLVVNGGVLVPTYGQDALDQQACNVLREVFPEREIVPIDARVIVRQHGSIHCLTMQHPEWKKS